MDAVCTVRAALHCRELVLGPAVKHSVRLLEASAYLDGRQTVEAIDPAVLTAVLWDSTAQRRSPRQPSFQPA